MAILPPPSRPEVICRAKARARGLKRYFTGKPCKQGHVAERRAIGGGCIECEHTPARRAATAARSREWYDNNKEKAAARQKIYVAENKEKVAEHKKAWVERNPNKRKQSLEKYQAHNALNERQRQSVYRAANRQKCRDRNRAWREANPDYFSDYAAEKPEIVRAAAQRRRCKIRNAPGAHTAKEILKLALLQRARCACCRASIKSGYHIDHIIPISKNGSNAIANIQMLCAPCNLSKGPKDPIDFMQSLGKLL